MHPTELPRFVRSIVHLTMEPSLRLLFVCFVFMAQLTSGARAQDSWRFSGQFFGDYAISRLSAEPDGDLDHAFQIRRIFFTADFPVASSMDGRFRVESTNRNTLDGTRSTPFLKDAYLRWKDALGPGHMIVFGLSAPPMWQVSQRFWSYRALARTIQHRAGLAGSRDTGIALYGPLGSSGRNRYGLMVGNDNIGAGDTDNAKHLYAQIDSDLSDQWTGAFGLDYRPSASGQSVNSSLFLGWKHASRKRIATELFYMKTQGDEGHDDAFMVGASLFGWYHLSDHARLILRVDRTHLESGAMTVGKTFALAGISFRPENTIEIIPNIGIEDDERQEHADLTARVTIYATF